jgi:hypothetical protein
LKWLDKQTEEHSPEPTVSFYIFENGKYKVSINDKCLISAVTTAK